MKLVRSDRSMSSSMKLVRRECLCLTQLDGICISPRGFVCRPAEYKDSRSKAFRSSLIIFTHCFQSSVHGLILF